MIRGNSANGPVLWVVAVALFGSGTYLLTSTQSASAGFVGSQSVAVQRDATMDVECGGNAPSIMRAPLMEPDANDAAPVGY